ncbi:RXT2-like protein [Triangularia verruculosa]|uniref:RXT2-like protein n=1 Tax=Triangularia verruculosa TaxID=2587418 RepID=A0AAN6X839_9PEZI|nr:RXT2-like protein [Triangularia verruculosa]
MSNQQQALVMETIVGIRKKLKRKSYDSDSDSSIDQPTNRGNKLKKRSRFVARGRLTGSAGPAGYKEIAEHAGYQRAIINHNPPLIDQDGYDITSDDDEQEVQEALATAMDDNPYSDVHLEQIFAPLASVTDLPTHPAMSKPFTSKALTELVDQARIIMQSENKALWKVKPLLTKLVGDNTWVPCGLMSGPDDALFFTDPTKFFNRPDRQRLRPTAALTNGVTSAPGSTSGESAVRERVDGGVPAPSAPASEDTIDGETLPDAPAVTNGETIAEAPKPTEGRDEPPQVNGDSKQDEGTQDEENSGDTTKDEAEDSDVVMAEAPKRRDLLNRPDIRLRTPALAPTSDPFGPDAPFIHPMFITPREARQDRNMGLAEHEAEELRRWLQAYVQKQEEVCRGAKKLYEQLLRADRLRKQVLMWAKAEAHCGPNTHMSDGEDWYDKEEWGLAEDLKKGEDEVEEDVGTTQKKTRNRK